MPIPTKGKGGASEQARLKVVIRRLPPDLPEAIFWKSVSPWVVPAADPTASDAGGERGESAGEEAKDRSVVWSRYTAGKVRRSGKDKDDVHSRAYITFKTVESLVAFHQGYDGWSFKSKSGNVSQAVVEFAPYQRTPPLVLKPDPRQSTIEQDPDYASFLVQLEAPEVVEKVEPTPVVDKKKPQSTPLLDHLRAQKLAERRQSKRPTGPVASTSKPPVNSIQKRLAQGFPAVPSGVSTPASESSSSLGKKSGSKSSGKGKGKAESTKGKGKASRPIPTVQQPRPPNMNSFPAFPPLAVNPNPAPPAPTSILQAQHPTSILPSPSSSGQASTIPLAKPIPSPVKSSLPPIKTNLSPKSTFPRSQNLQQQSRQNHQQQMISPVRLSPQDQQSLSLQLGIHQGMQQIAIAQEIIAQQMKMASPTGPPVQQLPFPAPIAPRQQAQFNLPPAVKQQPIRILAKPPTVPSQGASRPGAPRPPPMQQTIPPQQPPPHAQQQQGPAQRSQRLPAFLQNQQQNRSGPSPQQQLPPAHPQGPPQSSNANSGPMNPGQGRGARTLRGGGGGDNGIMGQRRTLDAALGAALEGNNAKRKGRGAAAATGGSDAASRDSSVDGARYHLNGGIRNPPGEGKGRPKNQGNPPPPSS